MVVDKDDNLILADGSFLRMYSKDGKSVKECKLGGKTWIFLTTKSIVLIHDNKRSFLCVIEVSTLHLFLRLTSGI